MNLQEKPKTNIRDLADNGVMFYVDKETLDQKDVRRKFVIQTKSETTNRPLSPKDKKEIKKSFKQ
jgi:hypothetical protein